MSGQKDAVLSDLNDLQKSLLTQVAYLDLTPEGIEKANSPEGITMSELKDYLAIPDQVFIGNWGPINNILQPAADVLLGDLGLPTDMTTIEQLEECGLGNLKITHVADRDGVLSNGFQAITFEDVDGNVGISYRGLDSNMDKGTTTDLIQACLLEYATDTSIQSQMSIEYFDQHKNTSPDGNTYIYGISNGGNMVQHVYLERHEQITEAFSMNGNPISTQLLDTPEKVAAFNDNKFQCFIVCGDLVSGLKGNDKYENNVHYIKNNNTMAFGINDPITSHMWQSGQLDENNNFVTTNRPEAIKEMVGYFSQQITDDPMQTIGNLAETAKEAITQPAETVRGGIAVAVECVTDLSYHVKGKVDQVLKDNPQAKSQLEFAATNDWKDTIYIASQDMVDMFNQFVRDTAKKVGLKDMQSFDIMQTIPADVISTGQKHYEIVMEKLAPGENDAMPEIAVDDFFQTGDEIELREMFQFVDMEINISNLLDIDPESILHQDDLAPQIEVDQSIGELDVEFERFA